MAVYCGACGEARNLPMSATRTGGTSPCDYCGNIDSVKREVPHPNPRLRNLGQTRTKKILIGNYSYPDHLLPGHPQGRDAQAAAERAGNG